MTYTEIRIEKPVKTPAELTTLLTELVTKEHKQQMPYPEKKASGGKDPNEIGALWEKKAASGGVYYTGEIAGQRVVVFPVNKKHDRSPALRVLKATEQGQRNATARQTVTDDDIQF